MSNRTFFVDVQGFRVEGKFIVKELSILNDKDVQFSYLFDPPTTRSKLTIADQRSVRYLENNHHRIIWEREGGCKVEHFSYIFLKHLNEGDRVVVRGEMKKRFLEEYRSLLDFTIEDYKIGIGLQKIKLPDKFIPCEFHSRADPVCARLNAYRLSRVYGLFFSIT